MSTPTLAHEPLSFDLPPALQAHEPPEARGVERDGVRLMVSRGLDAPTDHHARDLASLLEPADLLVVNTSGTLAAAVDARRADGSLLELHLSTRLPAGLRGLNAMTGLWLVEPREVAEPASRPFRGDLTGETLRLPGAGAVDVLARYPESQRLWVAVLGLPAPLLDYLARHGRPIRYSHVGRDWPIAAYQTVFATEPGSAEMPSAGRPITHRVITDIVARGVGITPLVLHAGVSSLEDHEAPPPEPFRVPAETAARVNATRAGGGRVIAVGTTVVRALESAADDRGVAHPGQGWADVIITPERGVRVVDGLLTGWHEPRASHLLMLEAVAGRAMLEEAYQAALDRGYLWHEFGDLHLILPGLRGPNAMAARA
ncbi:MAG: S-adenosylmethionine:tRNA ribosyltransferase-isomerase [Acidimicrobiales bacterium]